MLLNGGCIQFIYKSFLNDAHLFVRAFVMLQKKKLPEEAFLDAIELSPL